MIQDFPTDLQSERVVLSGVLTYGGNAFVDVDGLINIETFSRLQNQVIWRCAEEFYKDQTEKKFDVPSLLSVAKKLGLEDQIDIKYVTALCHYPVELSTVSYEAGKLYKLYQGKELDGRLAAAREGLRQITGDESISTILGIAENPIFDFTSSINDDAAGIVHIADGGDEWLEDIIAHPCDSVGIPSPFPKYNAVIGGGYRRGTVSVVAARMKTGKTIFADNISLHVAGTLGVPVLNIDTEMSQKQHLARILAHLSNIDSNKIERGDVTQAEACDLRANLAWLKTIPYSYQCVIDHVFDEHVASMRRWAVKHVGVNSDGIRNNCLVVYDYIQANDKEEFSNNIKEYQLLGFQMRALLRIAARCDLPILSLVQTNRDGIDKETTGVIAGSDRIGQKAANLSLLKRKTFDEIAENPDEGSHKLINLAARHGPGTLPDDYINVKFDGATARMVEGKTRFEIERAKEKKSGKIKTNIKDDEVFTL